MTTAEMVRASHRAYGMMEALEKTYLHLVEDNPKADFQEKCRAVEMFYMAMECITDLSFAIAMSENK